MSYSQLSDSESSSGCSSSGRNYDAGTPELVGLKNEPIAIIGMACRAPGDVSSPSELWSMLAEGRSGRRPIPETAYNHDGFYHHNPSRPDSMPFTHGHFLSGNLNDFDPLFFGISPVEASYMDPQQRKLLEIVYECLESAGVSLEKVSGSDTGCYVGVYTTEAATKTFKDSQNLSQYSLSGVGQTLAANRISYCFNLRGPSVNIDTACSSTLYALHLACESLRAGSCSECIVAGSNVILTPEVTLGMKNMGILSPTSMCHAFDESADGFARAEAINALYVKRLSKALADGDVIRAIIRGSAINSNGRGNGLVAPNAGGQERVIREAYRNAGILSSDIKSTAFFECHGTGTPVGDPIEVDAIGRTFFDAASENQRAGDNPLLIGSLKPNLGHGEAASGLSSVIKMVLAIEHDILPPTIGIKKLNPRIDFKGGLIKPITRLTPWPKDKPKRASINSSGYGGANAHVILEEFQGGAPVYEDEGLENDRMICLPFSAADKWSLEQNFNSIQAAKERYSLKDLMYTLCCKRSLMEHRGFAIVAPGSKSSWELVGGEKISSENSKIGYVFTGQGAQWPKMGLELMHAFRTFRQTLQSLDGVLQSLKDPPKSSFESAILSDSATINQPEVSQPLCTAIQIALVDLLLSFGVEPAVTVGHSSGEIAAAYASGRLSREHAILIAYLRGKAVARPSQDGAMLATSLTFEAFDSLLNEHPHLRDSVVYACHNSPHSGTLSGDRGAIEFLEEYLRENKEFARQLRTGGNAYHSHHMRALGGRYEASLSTCVNDHNCLPQRPLVPMFSSVTGGVVTETRLEPHYWRKNLESPVRFCQALQSMFSTELMGRALVNFIELGPHNALEGPIRDTTEHISADGYLVAGRTSYGSCLVRGKDSYRTLLELAGNLFLKGLPVDLFEVNGSPKARMITDLPSYNWNYTKVAQESIVHENRMSSDYRLRQHPRHDLLGARVPGCSRFEPVWRNLLRVKDVPWLADHTLGDVVVMPGAAFCAMALEAATQYLEVGSHKPITYSPVSEIQYRIQNMILRAALPCPRDDSGVDITLNLRPSLASPETNVHCFDFRISSHAGDAATEHCSGTVIVKLGKPAGVPQTRILNPFLPERVMRERYYDRFAECAIDFGPSFRTLHDIYSNSRTRACTAKIDFEKIAKDFPGESRYAVHPLIIDACFQAAFVAAWGGSVESINKGAIPVGIDMALRPYGLEKARSSDPCAGVRVYANGRGMGNRTLDANCTLVNSSGDVIIDLEHIRLTNFETSNITWSTKPAEEPFHTLTWKPVIDRLTPAQLKRLCEPSVPEKLPSLTMIETLAILLVVEGLRYMNSQPSGVISNAPGYIRYFYNWLEERYIEAHTIPHCDHSVLQLPIESQKWLIKNLTTELSSIPDIRLMLRMHSSLPSLITGEASSVEIMYSDDLPTTVYSTGFHHAKTPNWRDSVFDLLGHKNPRMRILEVGAGTGGTTASALQALGHYTGSRRYLEYTFTDISPAFLSDAQARFGGHGNLIFKTLDISRDPETQDYTQGVYDLIIAANVLHATANIKKTLGHCRKLLKPGGVLLLQEITNRRVSVELTWGLLSSYWSCREDGRLYSAFMSIDEWDTHLRSAGFSGSDRHINDLPNSEYTASLILATKLPVSAPIAIEPGSQSAPITFIYRRTPEHIYDLIKRSSSFQNPTIRALTDLDKPLPSRVRCVSAVELEGPLLASISERELRGLQNLAMSAKTLLWLTRGGLLKAKDPLAAMAEALARVLTQESPGLRFATVDIESDTKLDLLLQLEETLFTETNDNALDLAHIVDNGVLHVGRIAATPEANSRFSSLRQVGKHQGAAQQQWDPKLAVRLPSWGNTADTLIWENDLSSCLPLGPEEVEVHVKAMGLNKLMQMSSMGLFDTTSTSSEAVGEVTRVGRNVKRLKAGEKVMLIACGSSETFIRVAEWRCVRAPRNVESFEELATLPVSFATAIYALQEVAKMEEGESVLIQTAAGGTGIAAIEVAKYLGAEIFCTVGSDKKAEFLSKRYGIPRENILNSRAGTFDADLLERTNGRGVDVVICTMSGTSLHGSFRCLAPFGRLVELSRGDVFKKAKIDLSVFEKSITFSSFDINDVFDHGKKKGLRLLNQVTDMFEHGLLRPVPIDRVFHVTDVGAALQYFRKGVHHGKIILSYEENAERLLLVRGPPNELQQTFDPSATYILVGCLGGLGRSISTWMVRRGARNLLFLSRSGGETETARRFGEELRSLACGVNITMIKGDVSKKADVLRTTKSVPKGRPIRGVIQAAMVLNDGIFSSMSHSQFLSAIRPKVQGTLNLHNALNESGSETKLNFFLLLSSTVSYIGHISQANYAVANAFLDSFSTHRRHLNLPCTTLALGPVEDIGFVSHSDAAQSTMRRAGFSALSEGDVLAMLDVCLAPCVEQELPYLLTGIEAGRTAIGLDLWRSLTSDPRSALSITEIEAANAIITGSSHHNVNGASNGALNREAGPESEYSVDAIRDSIAARLAQIVYVPKEKLETDKALNEYGIDSLMGAELMNWLWKRWRVEVNFLELLAPGMTVERLAGMVKPPNN